MLGRSKMTDTGGSPDSAKAVRKHLNLIRILTCDGPGQLTSIIQDEKDLRGRGELGKSEAHANKRTKREAPATLDIPHRSPFFSP